MNHLFKRIAAVTLAAVLALTACACGAKKPQPPDPAAVTPGELTDAAHRLAEDHPALTFRALTVGTVPVVEVWADDGSIHPLAAVLHAEGSCKEDALGAAVLFAEAGYRAFVFDAPSHGERRDGQRRTVAEIAVQTGQELENILTYYYGGIETADRTRIALCGESMGGMAALWYVSNGLYRPFGVAVAMATAAWSGLPADGLMGQSYRDGVRLHGRQAATLPANYLAQNDPAAEPFAFVSTAIYLISGADDRQITSEDVYRWYGPALDAGADHFSWTVYQGCGHENRPPEFTADAIAWLDGYLPAPPPIPD